MKLFLPTSFIIISIILLLTVVNPYYKDVSSLRDAISAYNLALDNSSNLQKTQDSLSEKYKDIKQSDKDRLSHFLPNTVNNIEFILEVEKIASLHNLQIDNIKFETDQSQNASSSASISPNNTSNLSYGVFPLEFTVDADYNTFLLFLKDLELNLRLVDVQSISFTSPSSISSPTGSTGTTGNQKDSNIHTYSLKVQTYWLK
jgi:hypothetical protein